MSPRRLKLAGRSARGSGNQPPYGVAFTAGAADGVSIVVGAADCVTVSPTGAAEFVVGVCLLAGAKGDGQGCHRRNHRHAEGS